MQFCSNSLSLVLIIQGMLHSYVQPEFTNDIPDGLFYRHNVVRLLGVGKMRKVILKILSHFYKHLFYHSAFKMILFTG